MTLTLKDFVKDTCDNTQLNRPLVEMIAKRLDQWIHDALCSGSNVRLSMGTFRIEPNRYGAKRQIGTLRDDGMVRHYHAFRPCFHFLQKFKAEIDKNEEKVREVKG